MPMVYGTRTVRVRPEILEWIAAEQRPRETISDVLMRVLGIDSERREDAGQERRQEAS